MENHHIAIMSIDPTPSEIGFVEVFADDVDRWVFIQLGDESGFVEASYPLSILEAESLVKALKSAIRDAKRNRP